MRILALLWLALAMCLSLALPAAAAQLFADNFSADKTIADVTATWDLSPPPAGSQPRAAMPQETKGWQLVSGALAAANTDHAVAVASASPEVVAGELRASITAQSRAGTGGWTAAGLMLYQGPDHYWRLALVESPAGEHYCELVEQYGGTWQAQSAGRTALPGEVTVTQPWVFGKPYNLTITVGRDSITGEVRDGATPVFSRTYRFSPQIPAVHSGRPALEVVAMNASFDDVSAIGESSAVARGSRPPAAAILAQPGGEEIAGLATKALRDAKYTTTSLDPMALGDTKAFNRSRFDIIVLPRSEAIPGPGKENLLAFLRAGGHLIAFGGPPFRDLLWPWHGEWKTAPEILDQVRADKSIINFKGTDLTKWTRATANPKSTVEYELAPGPDGRTALRVHIGDLNGWETYGSPELDNPFPSGESLTCFWAKGSPRTSDLIIEWNERDGSRWIAAVQLGQEWRHYALRPDDFKYWRDSPTKDRGGPGDIFNPQNAARIIFGLAQSHSAIPNGEHTYWVADVGCAPSPFPTVDTEPPTLEGMSPWYKVYEIQLGAKDRLGVRQGFAAQRILPELSGSLISPIWRQRGLGNGAGQRGRWIPLIPVTTSDGKYPSDWKYRGVAASTYLATSGPYRGATWTYIGLNAHDVLAYFDFGWIVHSIASTIADGLMLVNAGSEQFSYFSEPPPGESARPPRLVARVMNIGTQPRSVGVNLRLWSMTPQEILDQTVEVSVAPGGMATATVDCPSLSPGQYAVACMLDLGRYDDLSIVHAFSVIGPPAKPEFITVGDGPSTGWGSRAWQTRGDFYLSGKKWYPHGLNFWPLYVAGLERFDYWLHWLSPSQYDPEAVERDLATLESLGVNMVSIQYGKVDQAPALNHFFQRAKAHSIHVNVFIPGTHPLMMDLPLAESLVRAARLDQSDVMFAYDLAWEPSLGGEEQRRRYDEQWAAWIEERYGSIESAERDWGFQVRRIDGKPTGPTNQQLAEDGDHHRMVAAYRRFADDLISQGYGKVTRFLRRLDPNHLFGARTGYGGTGQMGVAPVMPFDLVSGAAHLDFASAEGWGLWGEWKNFERAGFTTLYGRWATGGKPVFWAEFGYTIYPGTTPEKYVSQAEVYRNLYRMVLQSGANGSAGWWFPGGLRVDENSDFGVISPEGTPRAAAEELRKAAPQITAPRDRPEPDTWITIDRDLDVAGYAGTWERHATEYVEAVRAGKTVGLRTEADGMDSADAPRVAIGGTPCNGSNPPKYLNGEFGEVVLVGAADGKDVEVTDGAVIEVPAAKPLRIRAQVVNTGVASWLAGDPAGKPGGVYVAAGERAGPKLRLALPRDVPRYGSVEVEGVLSPSITEATDVTLALAADRPDAGFASGQVWFGQRLRFTLTPAK